MKWIARAWAAAVGLACFYWLASESTQSSVALLLSAALVATMGVPGAVRRVRVTPAGMRRCARSALVGCIMGALIPLVAAGMMLVKLALHSHVQPDYAPGDLLAVLRTIPVWAIAGGLVGAAAGLASGGRALPPVK